jgi:signal peptidase I
MQVGDFLFVEKRKFGLIGITDLDRPKRLAELE